MISQTVSIQETRDNLANIIDQVAIAGKKFLVTKFGKAKALIVPVEEDMLTQKQKIQAINNLKGIWADREDMKDSEAWVKKQRKKMSSRYGKIFT